MTLDEDKTRRIDEGVEYDVIMVVDEEEDDDESELSSSFCMSD